MTRFIKKILPRRLKNAIRRAILEIVGQQSNETMNALLHQRIEATYALIDLKGKEILEAVDRKISDASRFPVADRESLLARIGEDEKARLFASLDRIRDELLQAEGNDPFLRHLFETELASVSSVVDLFSHDCGVAMAAISAGKSGNCVHTDPLVTEYFRSKGLDAENVEPLNWLLQQETESRQCIAVTLPASQFSSWRMILVVSEANRVLTDKGFLLIRFIGEDGHPCNGVPGEPAIGKVSREHLKMIGVTEASGYRSARLLSLQPAASDSEVRIFELAASGMAHSTDRDTVLKSAGRRVDDADGGLYLLAMK